MSRPYYETKETIAAEDEIAKMVSDHTGFEWHRNKQAFRIDYTFTSGDHIRLLAEVKVRTHPYDQFETLKLSASKPVTAKVYEQVLNVPVILVVSFADCVRWIDLTARPDEVVNWGRKDRDDADDIEPSVAWRVSRFHTLESL